MSSADSAQEQTQTAERHTQPGEARPRAQMPLGPLLALWIAVGVAAAIVLLGVSYQALLPPLRGREHADPLTVHLAGIVELGAYVAMLATVGLLVAATFYSIGIRRHHELGERGHRIARRAGTSAAVWFGCSLAMIPLTAGENNGVGIGTVLGALGPFISATQAAQAWLVPAIIALAIAVTARRIRTVGAGVFALTIGVIWQLAPVVTGTVSVGANHDFGTDAAIWASIAGVLALASALACLLTAEGDVDTVRTRRYAWTLAIAGLIVVAGRLVVGWYELAGQAPLASGYGWLTALLITGWGILTLRGWTGLRRSVRRGTVALDLALGIVLVGVQTAMAHMGPPRFLVPQGNAQINFLGYDINTPPTWSNLLLPGRPNLLLVTVSIAALVLYVVGHLLLARRGVHWPVGRTAAWLCGWSLMGWVTSAGVWAYSGAAFSYHMLVHMTINMLAPVLIVLGAPVTLALRVLPTHPEHEPMGPRELINGLVNWKPLEYLLHPIVIGLNFISGTYLIYFTGLFEGLMRYHWGHQLMTVHFLISGLLFFGLIIGADRNPRELPHVAKLGFLFAAMPFHAFFAVALLSSDGIIGANFYRGLDVAWMKNLLEDQRIGGQYTWALGEIPMLVVVIALVIQWFLQDSRQARRTDRAMDEGLDDTFEAYNEMLRKLAERADR